MKFILTRTVTTKECNWLSRGYSKGTVVFAYSGYTYGCISDNGTAVSLDGDVPFFELPIDALKRIED